MKLRAILSLILLSVCTGYGAITIQITDPANGSTVLNSKPPITGIVQDSGTPQPGFLVPITINDVLIKTVITDINGIFNFTSADYGTNQLNAGANTIKAEATPAETIITVNFSTIEAPEIKLPSQSGLAFRSADLEIGGTAKVPSSLITILTVTNILTGEQHVFNGRNFPNVQECNGKKFDGTLFLFQNLGLPEGAYSFTVVAQDRASGITSQPSTEMFFIIDNNAPHVESVIKGSLIITGTAVANSTVSVKIFPIQGFPGCEADLGSTTADAQGKWILNSPFNCSLTTLDIIEVTATTGTSSLTTQVPLLANPVRTGISDISKSIFSKYCGVFIV